MSRRSVARGRAQRRETMLELAQLVFLLTVIVAVTAGAVALFDWAEGRSLELPQAFASIVTALQGAQR